MKTKTRKYISYLDRDNNIQIKSEYWFAYADKQYASAIQVHIVPINEAESLEELKDIPNALELFNREYYMEQVKEFRKSVYGHKI